MQQNLDILDLRFEVGLIELDRDLDCVGLSARGRASNVVAGVLNVKVDRDRDIEVAQFFELGAQLFGVEIRLYIDLDVVDIAQLPPQAAEVDVGDNAGNRTVT